MSDAEKLEKINRVIRQWSTVGFRANESYLSEIYEILRGPAPRWLYEFVAELQSGGTPAEQKLDDSSDASWTTEAAPPETP